MLFQEEIMSISVGNVFHSILALHLFVPSFPKGKLFVPEKGCALTMWYWVCPNPDRRPKQPEGPLRSVAVQRGWMRMAVIFLYLG